MASQTSTRSGVSGSGSAGWRSTASTPCGVSVSLSSSNREAGTRNSPASVPARRALSAAASGACSSATGSANAANSGHNPASSASPTSLRPSSTMSPLRLRCRLCASLRTILTRVFALDVMSGSAATSTVLAVPLAPAVKSATIASDSRGARGAPPAASIFARRLARAGVFGDFGRKFADVLGKHAARRCWRASASRRGCLAMGVLTSGNCARRRPVAGSDSLFCALWRSSRWR